MYRASVCFVILLVTSLASAHVNITSSWPHVHHIRRLLTEQYTVTSSLTTFTRSGQITWVSVQDSNLQHSHAKTWTQFTLSSSSSSTSDCRSHLLALYASPSDPSTTVPFTFVNVSTTSPDYCKNGKASVPVKLMNFRTPGFVLRLVSNGTFYPVILAESAVIANSKPNTPGQVHLALHADGQSMVVQWVSGSRNPQQLQYSSTSTTRSTSKAVQDEASRQYSGASIKWPPSRASIRSSSSSSGGKDAQGGTQPVQTVQSSSITYTSDMMCGVPANSFGFLDPGYLHFAVIPGAHVGHQQQLHYRVGSDAVGWSEPQTFTSPPSAASVASGATSFTFLVFNDVGQENAVLFDDVCPPYCPGGWVFEPYTANSTKLVKHLMAEREARLGLLVGDLAYASGYLVDWDYFGFQFEPAFSRWPVMMAAGNHEKDARGGARVEGNKDDSGGECGVPYTYRYYTPAWESAPFTQPPAHASSRNRVQQPASTSSTAAQQPAGTSSTVVQQPADSSITAVQQPAGTSSTAVQQLPGASVHSLAPNRSHYSFKTGGVHFIMLDSESPSGPDSPQGRFVAQDLVQVDRQRTPWLVVGVHRQMVGPTKDPVNVLNQQRLQSDLEDLFLKHKVDLVLQGHDHAYARTCPYAKGRCVDNPPGASSTRSSHSTPWRGSSSSSTTVPAGPPSRQYSAGTKAPSLQPQEVSTPPIDTHRSRKCHRKVCKGVVETVFNPGAPIYILAGHAGAGLTHAFPSPLPGWVRYGAQDRNGYVRVTVSGGRLRAVSVSTDDGSIMDGVKIVRTRASS